MKTHGRKSIRLKGFDYSEPGAYFVTICTKDRVCMFGDVVDGEMRLSEIGRIAAACWRAIPVHFGNTRVDVFQVMPNHVHGIVEIKTNAKTVGVEYIQPQKGRRGVDRRENLVGTRHAVSLQKSTGGKFGKPRPGTLSTIIGSFKSAVTKLAHTSGLYSGRTIWQSRFHDHIIRSDIDYYFVERYIELNPLLWHLDSDNPDVRSIPIDELQRILKDATVWMIMPSRISWIAR